MVAAHRRGYEVTATANHPARNPAREAMLAAVQRGLSDVPPSEHPDQPVERHYRRDREPRDRVGLLRDRLHDMGVEVLPCSPEQVAATTARALADIGTASVLCPPDLPATWRPTAANLYDDDRAADAAAIARHGAGLTGCALAIAETGTLVLDGGALSGRRLLSLVPDLHVCVVRERDVVGDVPQALAGLDPVAPLTFISGPSATVDIELVRTQGVHGPRALRVVLVTENAHSNTDEEVKTHDSEGDGSH